MGFSGLQASEVPGKQALAMQLWICSDCWVILFRIAPCTRTPTKIFCPNSDRNLTDLRVNARVLVSYLRRETDEAAAT